MLTLTLEKDLKQPYIIPQGTREKISPKLREAWKSRFVNKWNREHENRKKSNETKSWFFEKIIKIEKLIVRVSHEKRRCKIINEMEPL